MLPRTTRKHITALAPLVRTPPDSATIRAAAPRPIPRGLHVRTPDAARRRFFTFFTGHAALILQGAVELRAMLDNIGELEVRAHNIKTIESKADLVTHDTIQLLHQTSSRRWIATTFISSSPAWTTSSI